MDRSQATPDSGPQPGAVNGFSPNTDVVGPLSLRRTRSCPNWLKSREGLTSGNRGSPSRRLAARKSPKIRQHNLVPSSPAVLPPGLKRFHQSLTPYSSCASVPSRHLSCWSTVRPSSDLPDSPRMQAHRSTQQSDSYRHHTPAASHSSEQYTETLLEVRPSPTGSAAEGATRLAWCYGRHWGSTQSGFEKQVTSSHCLQSTWRLEGSTRHEQSLQAP